MEPAFFFPRFALAFGRFLADFVFFFFFFAAGFRFLGLDAGFGLAGALGCSGLNGDGVGWGSGDDGIDGNDGSIMPGPDQPDS